MRGTYLREMRIKSENIKAGDILIMNEQYFNQNEFGIIPYVDNYRISEVYDRGHKLDLALSRGGVIDIHKGKSVRVCRSCQRPHRK